jgi:hypothetical protein
MKKKTLADRLASAQARQANALSIFEQAAADLDDSAEALVALATEASDEIARLSAIRDTAQADAAKASTSASRVRALFA